MNYAKSRGLRANLSDHHHERPERPVSVLLHQVDAKIRRPLALSLRRDGYEVFEATTASAAIGYLRVHLPRRSSPELVIIDASGEGTRALEPLRSLGQVWALPPLMGVVGTHDTECFELATQLGFCWVLEAPVSPLVLRASVHAITPVTAPSAVA